MLPNLIIIGAPRSGTGSLHYYLRQHPEIIMSSPDHVELNFFVKELDYWDKGIEWYSSHFQGEAKIYGEKSPNYSCFPKFKGVPKRMHSIIPNTKLIYLVRDPIERLISQYTNKVIQGQETRSIYEVLEDLESNYYVIISRYYFQLKQYLKYYSPSQILVVKTENLKNKRLKTLRKIFNFLEVDKFFYSKKFFKKRNITSKKIRRRKPRKFFRYFLYDNGYRYQLNERAKMVLPNFLVRKINARLSSGEKVPKPTLSKNMRQRLEKCFREDVEKLKEFTGYKFKNWFSLNS